MSLLATSTPAAPPVMLVIASEFNADVSLRLRSSEWVSALGSWFGVQVRPKPGVQEKQSGRDARVSRVEISPGDLTLQVGQTVAFTAGAYDAGGAPVSGVHFKWHARDMKRQRAVAMRRDGVFDPPHAGEFAVSVEGARQTAEVTVRVSGEPTRADAEGVPLGAEPISTRDLPPGASARRAVAPRTRRAAGVRGDHSAIFMKASFAPPAAAPRAAARPATRAEVTMIESGWDGGNYWSADDPGNQVGDPPGGAEDEGAGSGNFQLTAPVLSLPGRGLNVSLALAYNSRVWNKATSEMSFDIDRGWPAPGWSLGFGKIIDMGGGSSMLVDADGTRRGFTGTVVPFSNGSKRFSGRTVDGSFIDYTSSNGCTNCGTISGKVYTAKAWMPDGTVIDYGAMGNGAVYPTRITDANGNFISITYRN
ncbi:MAG: hypothetical protein LC800_00285, partial [Acidobacteria bacterium]|nr:hypothetical protein [Acidobacteriota bacterium]